MKTITFKSNNASIYIFDDAVELIVSNENIVVGNPVQFVIADCNTSNIDLHENVTPPQDWAGHKYLFDGSNWSVNPNWIDPALPISA